MQRRLVVLLLAGLSLAAPASASAHARAATIALDYKLVLHPAVKRLPGVDVSILDGDRSLQITVHRGLLTIRGDLDEAMLRLGPGGAWANRSSLTAVSEKLVNPGRSWQRISSGSTFTWHEHRLSPPPYGNGRPGPVASFSIPATLDGRPVDLGGTFVRYARPSVWPWVAAALVAGASLAAALRLRPRLRGRATTALGTLAGLAALGTLVTFGVADAANGRVAWAQIVIGGVIGVIVAGALIRLGEQRRVQLAGLIGLASVVVSLGWLSAFWHGVIISLLSATATRLILVIGLVAGATAAVTSFTSEEAR
jgi:hypothetical protein